MASGQAAKGNGGVLIPGGIKEMCGHGTKRLGLVVGLGRVGCWPNMMILKSFCNLDDFMIPNSIFCESGRYHVCPADCSFPGAGRETKTVRPVPFTTEEKKTFGKIKTLWKVKEG